MSSSVGKSESDIAQQLPSECLEAIGLVLTAACSGTTFSVAVLYALGMWTLPVETFRGHLYKYLIQDEAFDWALLTDRLINEVSGVDSLQRGIWSKEVAQLLENSSSEQLRQYLGVSKYRTYLNYLYGVTVEMALQAVVWDGIKKYRVSAGLLGEIGIIDQSFVWIYGEPRSALINKFSTESTEKLSGRFDNKAFTYWLSRLRMKHSEPVRFASDTRIALEWLDRSNKYAYIVPGR